MNYQTQTAVRDMMNQQERYMAQNYPTGYTQAAASLGNSLFQILGSVDDNLFGGKIYNGMYTTKRGKKK